MKAEYEKLIDEHDKTLSSLRKLWMNAESDSEKDRFMQGINRGLDDRLRLMRCRDA